MGKKERGRKRREESDVGRVSSGVVTYMQRQGDGGKMQLL